MIPLRDDNPSELKPVLTTTLIVVCTLTFLWQLAHGSQGAQAVIYSLGLIPSVLFGIDTLPEELVAVPPILTIFTSMFLHGGWMHLIGNMLYLWIFGDNVEDAMGHVRFLVFYLTCGVAAALAQALPDPHSTLPMVGASGAISGVLGAYLLLYPHARVLVGIPFGFYLHMTRLPAGVVLALWFGLQFLSNVLSPPAAGGGVAFRAHIGGFVAGMVLVALFKRRGFRLMNPLRSS
ncbi:MAG TPA: rhomboid family intramembrane serine protease [Steroidobacteraceae bacterium]|nr:rhomboid family intramembrane serine protease [Steroidobacteraceae bacterium]